MLVCWKPTTRWQWERYQQVERIWEHPYAWPRPGAYTRAQERIREIIDQANIGKQTPYLGIIYLWLGELHEERGDSRPAIEIYRDVIDLFPGREGIVSEANNHLTCLGVVP